MADTSETTVVILCGGRGTRLQGAGVGLPKPLVEIGGMPIVWHVVMAYYASGFRRFLLLTGYQGEQIEAFVADSDWPEGLEIEAVDTGVDTSTGGRVHAVADRLKEERAFCLTYADGLTDADLGSLLTEHLASGADTSITVVRPELPFGVVEVADSGMVTGFTEKPRSGEWVNGGFFCAGPELLDALDPVSALETGPMEELARRGRLRAHRHDGFWACMDTYKEATMLNDLWKSGEAPWRRW